MSARVDRTYFITTNDSPRRIFASKEKRLVDVAIDVDHFVDDRGVLQTQIRVTGDVETPKTRKMKPATIELYVDGELRRFRLKRTADKAWRAAKRAGKSVWSADHVDAHGRLRPGTHGASKEYRAQYRREHPHVKSKCAACRKGIS